MALASSAGIIEFVSVRDQESRQHERREATVAGAVRHEIASDHAEARYRECIKGSKYDDDCARHPIESVSLADTLADARAAGRQALRRDERDLRRQRHGQEWQSQPP